MEKKGVKILILDDDRTVLEALSNMLAEHEYEVECCDNAKQAVEMVAGVVYDFILVDYKMPENDGIWFMKNAKLPRETKVLLITAYVNRHVIDKMFELGASGYLIKPFDEEYLIRNVEFHGKGGRVDSSL